MTSKAIPFRCLVNKPGVKAQTFFSRYFLSGQQGEAANSFLATLASSSSEEMEAELQERVESSQKQANHVVEIYERLKSTVDQLKAEIDSGAGELKSRRDKITVMKLRIKYLRWKSLVAVGVGPHKKMC